MSVGSSGLGVGDSVLRPCCGADCERELRLKQSIERGAVRGAEIVQTLGALEVKLGPMASLIVTVLL